MSELQQICVDLVGVIDDGVAVSEQLVRSGRQLRTSSARAAGLAGSSSADLRRLAEVLDMAGRRCLDAAEQLRVARRVALDWANRTTVVATTTAAAKATAPPTAATAGAGLPPGFRLTQEKSDHIAEGHAPTSTDPTRSKFDAAVFGDLRAAIGHTITHGAKSPNIGRPGTIFTHTFPHPVGTKRNGSPTHELKVVVDPSGAVVTAYPYR